MAEVLLIHGSGFGAWAWDQVIPALAAYGHSAQAIDLPGRGGIATSLDAQAQAICAALSGPTVLVGHSAGGYPITAAAQLSPWVTGLIYIAAYIPQPGKSVADLRRAGPSQPMRGAFQITPDRRAYGFAPDRCEDLFFHDCLDPDAATARMCLEPIAPQETPLAPGFAFCSPTLRSAAVICTKDRAIPPAYQREMAATMPCNDLPCGHAPFLAQPAALAATLHQILAGWA